MKCRGEGRCCDLLNIACKAHQQHRLEARVSPVSIKTFWACWKSRYETKNRENAERTRIRSGRFDWGRGGNEIIVYKSVLSVLRQEFSLLMWLHVRPENEPQKIGRCRYFWIFRTDQKKIRSSATPPPPSIMIKNKNYWMSKLLKELSSICILDNDVRFIECLNMFKNWFMPSVRISSYGCTREVWRARKKRKSCSRRSREQL